jgi:hypothetical protein
MSRTEQGKKIILQVVLMISIAIASTDILASSEAVNVLAPDNYISPKLISELKNEKGIALSLYTYSTENVRDAILESQESEFDIVISHTDFMHHLVQSNRTKRLPHDIATKNKYERNDQISQHAYLLSYVQYGIATKKNDETFSTWSDFFHKGQKYRGDVSLTKQKERVLDAISVTNANEITDDARSLWRYIKKIKPVFLSSRDYEHEGGNYSIHMLSNLDFVILKEFYGEEYVFHIPEGPALLRKTYATLHSDSRSAVDLLRHIVSLESQITQQEYHREMIAGNNISSQVDIMNRHNIISPDALPRKTVDSDAEAMKKAYLIDRIVDAYQD